MPTYEYVCKSCGTRLEVVQSFSDEPLRTCTNCGGDLKKVFGNVGIVFKGSGFYKTDSRSAPSSVSTPSESTAAPASTSDNKPSETSTSAGPQPPASTPAPATTAPGAPTS